MSSLLDSPLRGAFNFRDLGGLLCRDGRRPRHGVLFRSDTLQAPNQRLIGIGGRDSNWACSRFRPAIDSVSYHAFSKSDCTLFAVTKV
ncbi:MULTISPECIES: tyrosine-protein phosphatase [unclassified Methylibium]|uniref:tyrosine-protein phosphatase n=1 Tax=unclassified Methylibium TaxID=2633235 RepID=UPI0009DE026E|nr:MULTISPECIES: tyrosine-protein phosphatase [unclassified Methylibium]